jgi:hypothetical protein
MKIILNNQVNRKLEEFAINVKIFNYIYDLIYLWLLILVYFGI